MKILKKMVVTSVLTGALLSFGSNDAKAAEIPVGASITPTSQTVKPNTNVYWTGNWGGGNNYYWNFYFSHGDGTYESGTSYYKSKSFFKKGGYSLGNLSQKTVRPFLTVHSGSTNTRVNATVIVK